MCERVSVCVSVRVWWGGLTGHPPLRAGRGRSVAPLGGPGSRDIPPHGGRPVPCGGQCQSPVSLRSPGPRLACPPPLYPREAEANRRGADSWWWRMRCYSGQVAWQCLGSPPGAPGWVGGDSSPSKPVAGRPRLRQTSNICLEPSLLPALTTIYKNYFYQRNTHLW